MRSRWGAHAAIAGGLLLALAATAASLPAPGGAPGASLAVRLPDPARTAVVVLLALSVLLLLALQRPRRPADEGGRPGRPGSPRSPWAALVALLPLLALVGVAWYLATRRWGPGEANPLETAFAAIADLLDLLAAARKPAASMPLYDLAVTALLLALALALFAGLLLVALSGPLARWWARRARAPARAGRAGVDAPADQGRGADARVAIARAWRRFERAAAAARAPRAPWQTPAEFRRTTLARLPVPPPAVDRLTTLVELARFSERPLDAAAGDAAWTSVDEITAALDEADRSRATGGPDEAARGA